MYAMRKVLWMYIKSQYNINIASQSIPILKELPYAL